MAQRTDTAVQFPPSLAARVVNVVIHAILMLGAVFMVLPMVWMLATSFKPPPEIAALAAASAAAGADARQLHRHLRRRRRSAASSSTASASRWSRR